MQMIGIKLINYSQNHGMSYWLMNYPDAALLQVLSVYFSALTRLAGELGLKGFTSNFFSADFLAGGNGLSVLNGFSSKKVLGAIFSLNAPPFIAFLCASVSRYEKTE